MVIAVFANFTFNKPFDSQTIFIKTFIQELVTFYPQHSFYWIGNGHKEFYVEFPNLYIIQFTSKPKLFSKYLVNQKLRSQVNKIKATVLLSFESTANAGLSQSFLLVQDNQKFKKDDVNKWSTIFTFSAKTKNYLATRYKIEPSIIHVLYGGPLKTVKQLSYEESFAIKERHTGGKEYFFYCGGLEKLETIIDALKNFSLFKKRQKSSMKLMLLQNVAIKKPDYEKLINTYKYREDVLLMDSADEKEIASIIEAAFALIHPHSKNNLVIELAALKNGIPLITDTASPLIEIAAGAALYFDITIINDLAEKMMLIYKDENLRQQLINNGQNISAKYGWQQTIETVGESLAAEN